MKKIFVIICVSGIIVLLFTTVLFPYISNFVGWHGYKVWENRSKTTSIKESKKRKVFVKELNYEIIYSGDEKAFHFKPYLEYGFKVSNKSMKDSRIINDTKYPYNISFERNLMQTIALRYEKGDEKKLDSFDGYWGYLKQPYLKDTLRIKIEGENNHNGVIKIW